MLKDNTDPNDNIAEAIKRLFKMLKIFEKLGYSTDPYLGNLTVSPKDLGTGLKLHCTLSLTPTEQLLEREIAMKLIHDCKIDYKKVNRSTHTLET